MPWFIPAVAVVASTAVASYSAYNSNQQAKKQANAAADAMGAQKAQNEAMIAAVKSSEVTPEASSDAAKAATEKQRRMRALAGGKTLLASSGPTLSSTTGSKSLLGA